MAEAVMSRRCLTTVLTGLLLAGTPQVVEAKGNCDAQGGLFYLGNAKGDTRSIWLSATSPGSFRLEAAQGNTTVDQWSKSHRGLNVTASPFVSTGNGGVHRLFDTSGNKDCLIDTQNQKGGFVPPHIIFPIRPNGYIPLPKLPTLHPTGYIPLPSVPTIHPTGYIPLPSVPTIHPTGYIPLPNVPTIHPTGYIPLPPLPPLPPRPPGPTPPGPTPPGPTPPGPTPPGPIPPIPNPVGPTPPGPTPVGPVNPAYSVTPGSPAAVATLPRDEGRYVNCPDARTRATLPPGTRLPPECEELYRQNPEGSGLVPITPGRDLGVGVTKPWNVWVDANFINSSDGRYGLDVTGWSRIGTVGLDRR